jgi:hypothetical protein
MSRTRGLISGVPLGACCLFGGGAAGNFPATASASHSSMVLPDLAWTACSELDLAATGLALWTSRGKDVLRERCTLAPTATAGEKATVEAMAG